MRKTYRKSYKKISRRRKHYKKTVSKKHKRKSLRQKYNKGGNEEGYRSIPTLRDLTRGDNILFKIEKPILDNNNREILTVNEDDEDNMYSGIISMNPLWAPNDPDVYWVQINFNDPRFNATPYNFFFTNDIEKGSNPSNNQISIIRKLN